jgi:cytochrome o ubiquinol oxidase subunit II
MSCAASARGASMSISRCLRPTHLRKLKRQYLHRCWSLCLVAIPGVGSCQAVLHPQGPIGAAERLVLLDSLSIMLVIVVPVIIAIFAFAWWFRSSNARATYRPAWSFSGHLELIVWAIPALVITFMGGIAWFGSQALDPYRRLPSARPAIEVEVVSLDWKWLFIYPQEGVATINELTIPAGTPVHFRLTSSGVMNSFFIPQLGSQIYTMAAMTSQLNLQADKTGSYRGLSAQFSGPGFSDMHFEVHAVPLQDYRGWIAETRSKGIALDAKTYATLARPSGDVPPRTFGAVEPGLFDSIVHESAPTTGNK